jgi:MFS family permease
MLAGGIVLLVIFILIEQRVRVPLFQLSLFRVRAFITGSSAAFLTSVARGGLMFMLTIWLQGIWLPLHGYDFEVTPLWAGIYMIPNSVGFLMAGPLSGRLSDQFGARYFATLGLILASITFVLLLALPVDFRYPLFASIIFLNGLAMGMFIAPNTAAIMNSVPPQHRGASSGMLATLNSVGIPLSMGIFFSLLIEGMNASVPAAMYSGLTQNGIPGQVAQQLSSLPPIGYLFAAFMGYNPLGTLIPSNVFEALPPGQAATITSRSFFPQLIDSAFHHGLAQVMLFSMAMCLLAAAASWLRGGRYVYRETGE